MKSFDQDEEFNAENIKEEADYLRKQEKEEIKDFIEGTCSCCDGNCKDLEGSYVDRNVIDCIKISKE